MRAKIQVFSNTCFLDLDLCNDQEMYCSKMKRLDYLSFYLGILIVPFSNINYVFFVPFSNFICFTGLYIS
jgi:hypothetical protein